VNVVLRRIRQTLLLLLEQHSWIRTAGDFAACRRAWRPERANDVWPADHVQDTLAVREFGLPTPLASTVARDPTNATGEH